MNYIEDALAAGTALWRAWEESVRRRLALAAQGTAVNAKGTARRGEAEALPAAETERERLRRRLFPEEAEEGAAEAMKKESEAAEAAAEYAAKAEESTELREAAARDEAQETRAEERREGASAWLARELRKGANTPALSSERRGESGRLSAQETEETAHSAAFSQELERDARRYDGGFLYY